LGANWLLSKGDPGDYAHDDGSSFTTAVVLPASMVCWNDDVDMKAFIIAERPCKYLWAAQ
jgi:hypothetical protein